MSLSLETCRLCPRRCGVDRSAGGTGICAQSAVVKLARAALHFWEEPPISGTSGSGTVFFSGCPLHCVYCQNVEIANGGVGRSVTVERLAQIFLEEEARGARNINLVTPTHYVPQIVEALDLAREGKVAPRDEMLAAVEREGSRFPYARLDVKRLDVPVVYNSGGYESVETIEALRGHVDVYLPDFKYASRELARRYSHAPDYPEAASAALDAMYASVGPCRFEASKVDGEESLVSGVIVRHLMLPGRLDDSKRVVDVLAAKPYAQDMWVSLMSQYTPMPGVGERFPELASTVDAGEYDELVDYALERGLENSYMQEGGAAEESFIPAFDCEGV